MTIKPIIRDFFTGVLAIFGIAGVIIMLVIFGEFADNGKKFYEFTVHVSSASGLTSTSSVTLNGVKVGQVVKTSVVLPPGSGAEVRVKVYEGTIVPKAVRVSIEKGFVGDAVMELQIPPGTDPAAIQDTIAPDSVFEGGDAMSTLGRLAQSIQGPMARFGQTADSVEKLAATYTTLGERLNDMVEPRTLADVQSGKDPNVRSAIARADAAMAQAQRLLSDDEVVGQAKAVLARANTLMDEFSGIGKSLVGQADKLSTKADAVADSVKTLTEQAAGTMRTADKAANELATILETINKGQGTAGLLIQNPDLYNSLRDAAQGLDRALAEIRLLVEKYRAEGIPLHF